MADLKGIAALKTKVLPVKEQPKKGRPASAGSAIKDIDVPVSTWRYNTVVIIFSCLFLGLIFRAVQLQIVENDYLQSQGDARYLRVQKEPPTRGR